MTQKILLFLLLAGAVFTERSHASDEYNFSWLDPDKKIYVLQNRKFLKGDRAAISVMGGTAWSNSYRRTMSVDPRLAYYFNETFGLEGFYTIFSNSENDTFKALQKSSPNALPVVREIRAQYGLLLHYVPWYAKINVYNSILYFDWYFTGGAGQVAAAVDLRSKSSADPNYDYQNQFAFFLGTGHQYQLSRNFFIRLDYTAAIYQAYVDGISGEKSWFSNSTFGIGGGVRF